MDQLLAVIAIYIVLVLLCFMSRPQKILLTPQFCFIGSFLPGMIYAIFYVEKWELQLSAETMFVLIGGACTFFVVAICYQFVFRKIHPAFFSLEGMNCHVNDIIINKNGLYILTVFDIITLIWSLVFIISKYGTNLSKAIYSFRVSKVLGEEEVSFGMFLSNFRFMSFTLGLIWGYLLAFSILYKKRHNRRLYILNFIICIVTDLISGARGDTLLLVAVTLVSYYILYKIKTSWKSNLRIKTMMKAILLIVVLLLTYRFVGNLLGRGEVGKNSDFIAKYLSAEIKNFDTFMRHGEKGTTLHDWLTLRVLMTKIEQYTSNYNIVSANEYIFGGNRGFLSVNGFNLGNVYTAYFSYVHDLGLVGCFVFPGIMSFVSQAVFLHTVKSTKTISEKNINIWIIIYGYILFTVAFSFFSDRFFGYIFSFAFIKRLIFLKIGVWIINGNVKIWNFSKIQIK